MRLLCGVSPEDSNHSPTHPPPLSHPQELAARRVEVLARLKELQNEIAPLMKKLDELKNTDVMKDSKTLVSVLQKEIDVSIVPLSTLAGAL